MKDQSKESATIKTLFQNKAYFARFVYGSVFKEFAQNIEASSALKDLIDTVEFYSDTALTQLTDRTKRNVKESASRDPYVIHQLGRLDREPLLDTNQFSALHSLLDTELDIDVFDDNELPNIMLATPSKYSDKMCITLLICRNCERERNFTFEKVSQLHENLPHLVSLKLHSVTITGFPTTPCKSNQLRYLDIKFYSIPRQLANLLLFITKSYSSHLKEFTMEQLGPNVSSDLVDLKSTDVGANKLLKDGCEFKFPRLRSLKLNNLYHYPKLIAKFVDCIFKEECKLRKVALKGLYNRKLIKLLSSACSKTLISLTANIDHHISLTHIEELNKLKRLRLCLHDSLVNVSLLDVLKAFPNLDQLDFGYELNFGDIRRTMTDKETFGNLRKLSIYNISYDEESAKKLEAVVPSVKKIIFSNCKLIEKGEEKDVNLTFKRLTPDSTAANKDVTEELTVGMDEKEKVQDKSKVDGEEHVEEPIEEADEEVDEAIGADTEEPIEEADEEVDETIGADAEEPIEEAGVEVDEAIAEEINIAVHNEKLVEDMDDDKENEQPIETDNIVGQVIEEDIIEINENIGKTAEEDIEETIEEVEATVEEVEATVEEVEVTVEEVETTVEVSISHSDVESVTKALDDVKNYDGSSEENDSKLAAVANPSLDVPEEDTEMIDNDGEGSEGDNDYQLKEVATAESDSVAEESSKEPEMESTIGLRRSNRRVQKEELTKQPRKKRRATRSSKPESETSDNKQAETSEMKSFVIKIKQLKPVIRIQY